MTKARPALDVVRSGAHRGAELGRGGAHLVAEMGRGAWEPIRERREQARRRERRRRMLWGGLIGLGGLAVGFLLGRWSGQRATVASMPEETWEPSPDAAWRPEQSRAGDGQTTDATAEVAMGERSPI